MPRNTTGGSGHKAQRNSEGSKARHNREHIDDLLDDYRKGEKTDGVFVARVLRRMGNGRMEIFFIKEVEDSDDEETLAADHPLLLPTVKPKKAPKIRKEPTQQIVPMRGGLRGKAKKTVWVDIDSLVMVADTGLGGTTHEIIAVFSADQVARYRKFVPDADERLFLKNGNTETPDGGEGYVFEKDDDGDVDIDDI